jgi:N-acetylmuramic acid 6-phosphate etherase
MHDRSHILTEQRLAESMNLDSLSVADAVALMHAQDIRAVEAVGREQNSIAQAVTIVVDQLRAGGRLIYVGAGTSGRLGVLDASECPPTFRTDPDMVQGIIAGGDAAMFRSQEGAEDSAEAGATAIIAKAVNAIDVVLGIAAGGTTPFVHGAMRQARASGAKTIFLTCAQATREEPPTDLVIRPLVGPEVVTGSTRLKAGTATKLVLNAITTIAMVQLGKVYENLMVDLRASNAKLRDRAIRIICAVTGATREKATELLQRADGHVKTAIVMQSKGVSRDEAEQKLQGKRGSLRDALK